MSQNSLLSLINPHLPCLQPDHRFAAALKVTALYPGSILNPNWIYELHRDTKEKLVAYRGKLVSVQEAVGEAPNGSGFVITLGPAPGLDSTNLVVGRVVEGLDLVRQVTSNISPRSSEL